MIRADLSSNLPRSPELQAILPSPDLRGDCPSWPPDVAEDYRQRGYWQRQTLGEWLAHQSQCFGTSTALVDRDRRWSYAELDRRVDRLATGFQSLGLMAGDRVVVQLPNSLEFFAVFFALTRLGALPILALPAHRQIEIQSFIEHAEAIAYVLPDRTWNFDYRQLARTIQTQCPSLQHVIVVGEAQEFCPLDRLDGDPKPFPDLDPEAVAFFQLSGGSTGVPKLIPRTHADYLYSVRVSAEICRLTPDSTYLVALPASHNFPLSSPGSLGTLAVGGKVVLARHPNPDEAFALIEQERVTITALVPPLVLAWLEAVETRDRDLSSLQVLQVGGAKLTPEVAGRITPTLGCQLQQVFGMGEGLVCYTRLDDDEETIHTTQGRPLSSADEIRVVDDDDRPVASGEVGHLLTRGPYTIRGYYRAPEQNRRDFTIDGFYRTGDRVCLTPSGNLIVEGRAKELINRAGEKVSAEEVESHLLAYPDIYNVAVVAMPDRFLGEGICAFLVRNSLPDRDIQTFDPVEIQALKQFLRDRGLADYKIPDRFEGLITLPHTGAGKVDKKFLRQQLLS